MECLQFRVDPWAFSFQGISYNDDDELWPMFNSYIYIGPVCVCRSLSLIYFSGNFSPAFNLNVHFVCLFWLLKFRNKIVYIYNCVIVKLHTGQYVLLHWDFVGCEV